MSNWQIGESGTDISLDAKGHGQVTLTVTNTGDAQDRAVLTVTPLDGAADGWFTIPEPQKVVPPGQSVTYVCEVDVPPETAVGTYGCQFVVYSADRDPGETSATSKRMTLPKKAPVEPDGGPPWPLIALAVVVVVIVVGVLVWLLTGDDGGDGLANTSVPTISGSPQVLQPLAAAPGEWNQDGVAFTFRWQRCDAEGEGCDVIDGAALPAYAVGADDVGRTLRVEVTATKGDASARASSAPTEPVADVAGAPVTVSDVVGRTVSEAFAILGPDFQVVRLTAGSPVPTCDPPVTDQSPNGGVPLERGEVVAISAPPSGGIVPCLKQQVATEIGPLLQQQRPGPIPEEDLSGITDKLVQGP